MNNDTTAVNNSQSAAADKTVAPAAPTEVDAEVKIAQLEAEKQKLIEERDNYRTGMLKAKSKLPESSNNNDESDDDRLRRIAREELANSRLAEITLEQDDLIKKALKENKELKLAQMNKTTAPASMGSHSESKPVTTDVMLSPDQLSNLKARGWSDKDIENYKKNLTKNGQRVA